MASSPPPSGYRAAQLQARRAAGSLTQDAARRVIQSIDEYAKQIDDALAGLPIGATAAQRLALDRALGIARQASDSLAKALSSAITQSRNVAFSEVLSVWQEAQRALSDATDVPNALLGRIGTPKLRMAGAFASLGGVSYMQSLTASAKAGGTEVERLIRTGITSNVSPQELAKRLRPYVRGAEAFEAAFPKKDERFQALYELRDKKLPPELRNAAFRVRSNSLRIAYSEIHNARAEAELQAFAVDPLVSGVRWTLSPFRGSQGSPDICDALASNDWYGLGAGVYPLDGVPLPPHPHDRCERVPVTREPSRWHEPKPRGLQRALDPDKAIVTGAPGSARLTAAEQARIRKQLRRHLALTDDAAAQTAMRSLMDQGERAAKALVRERATISGNPAPANRGPRAIRDRLPGWNGPTGTALRAYFQKIQAQSNRLDQRLVAQIKEVRAAMDAATTEQEKERLDQRFGRLLSRWTKVRLAPPRMAEKVLRSDAVNGSRFEFAEKFDKKRRERYQRAIDRFRELWGDRVPAAAQFVIRSRAGRLARRYTTGRTRAFWLESIRTAFLEPEQPLAVIVHEFTHGAEYAVPAIHERALAFRAKRAAGERSVRLKDLYPNSAYQPDEIAVKDRFDELMGTGSAYAGRIYRGDQATEILTMGVQWLVDRPLEFAQRDPEYFDFIIETLWGAL